MEILVNTLFPYIIKYALLCIDVPPCQTVILSSSKTSCEERFVMRKSDQYFGLTKIIKVMKLSVAFPVCYSANVWGINKSIKCIKKTRSNSLANDQYPYNVDQSNFRFSSCDRYSNKSTNKN